MRTGLPLFASLAVMAGCASTNESVRTEIARTEATVQQVPQSRMTRNAGELEFEQATDIGNGTSTTVPTRIMPPSSSPGTGTDLDPRPGPSSDQEIRP